MQENTVWELFFDVTNLDWHVRTKIIAVNINHTWIAIIETPNLDFFLQEMEQTTSLKMQTFIFTHWVEWQGYQVWSSWDVSLEINQYWLVCLKVFFDIVDGHHNFLIIMSNIEWSDETVISLSNSVWGTIWEH